MSAGPVGRNAAAGTDWKLNTDFLTYSRSKGLFAGIDLSGSEIERDGDSTKAMYGEDYHRPEFSPVRFRLRKQRMCS